VLTAHFDFIFMFARGGKIVGQRPGWGGCFIGMARLLSSFNFCRS
jgi:hypothetical protein